MAQVASLLGPRSANCFQSVAGHARGDRILSALSLLSMYTLAYLNYCTSFCTLLTWLLGNTMSFLHRLIQS